MPVLHLNHGSLPEYCSKFGITFDLHDFEIKLEEIISKYDFSFEKLSKYNFDDDDMINEYHILIKKLVSKRVKKGLKNKLYLFYLNKILKFLKVFENSNWFKNHWRSFEDNLVFANKSTNYNNISASVWIRALQIIPYLENINVESYINNENIEADLAIFVRRQDAVDYELATRLKKRNIKLILDLCVNYFIESSAPGMMKPVTKKHIDNCVRMTNLCDAVFCASMNIKDSARKFNKKSYYLPDSVDERHFKYIKRKGFLERELEPFGQEQPKKLMNY